MGTCVRGLSWRRGRERERGSKKYIDTEKKRKREEESEREIGDGTEAEGVRKTKQNIEREEGKEEGVWDRVKLVVNKMHQVPGKESWVTSKDVVSKSMGREKHESKHSRAM